ncbi:LacI family DNA-binding transcriptional regulator [Microbacterium sp.]|uniref:LacI family DNA-binding transcriptional regulator n=1 Tax=Microbacterium sp. TaxID=51671 RepID=UPI00261689FC|nr:LacI family DNA-binding transcriptional regulator [Microbacterium sp.]
MTTSPRPTLTSIARSLGLSTATISNVYNHPERVSDGVRDRVLQAAEAAGYAGPDAVARRFRRGTSDTVGVVFTDEMSFALADPASVALLAGLSTRLQEARLNMLLLPAGPPLDDSRVSNVMSAVVDGFIFYSVPEGDPHLAAALRRRLPTVVVDEPRDSVDADWVGLDDGAAAADLGEHLAHLGHRNIGVITSRLGRSRYNGPADDRRWSEAVYSVQRNRIAGLQSGLADDGALFVEERFENSVEAGADALQALLVRHPEVTAVCCFGDVLAIGALEAARRSGLSVPGDVTITGFDDIPEAARVGLTTVQQPLAEKGRVAGELLLSHAHGAAPRKRFLPTSLEVRATSGPPR